MLTMLNLARLPLVICSKTYVSAYSDNYILFVLQYFNCFRDERRLTTFSTSDVPWMISNAICAFAVSNLVSKKETKIRPNNMSK